MFIDTARTGVLMVLAAALATGCATVVAPTDPAALPQVRANYVIGYLQPAELPDSQALVPPPPAAGSAAFAADEDVYRSTRKLLTAPRGALATKDANLEFPNAAETFSCALDMPISAEATPHLNMLLRRVRADASRATDKAKDFYKRRRPFLAHGDLSCTPKEKMKDDSYPSGHSSIGWAWGLVLSEIAPDRINAILPRAAAFGQSRVVCGVHWKSDVEAGRLMGAAAVSRLHANPVFTAQMAEARKEIEAARAAGAKSLLNCAAEAQALAGGQ
jgi:acid phosphatase (class A)